MSKLKKERLNQMIENALSYKQEVEKVKSSTFFKRLKSRILKPSIYGFTFASLISFIFVPQIVTSKVLSILMKLMILLLYGILRICNLNHKSLINQIFCKYSRRNLSDRY